MTPEVRDAIDNARTAALDNPRLFHLAVPQRRNSFEHVRALLLAVVQKLPDDMTMVEPRDELEIGAN